MSLVYEMTGPPRAYVVNGPFSIVRALKGDARFWKMVTCPRCLKKRRDAA